MSDIYFSEIDVLREGWAAECGECGAWIKTNREDRHQQYHVRINRLLDALGALGRSTEDGQP
ncbi:hypothetical protein ACFVH6_22250 [Spirillospora sp. NPDC127200]